MGRHGGWRRGVASVAMGVVLGTGVVASAQTDSGGMKKEEMSKEGMKKDGMKGEMMKMEDMKKGDKPMMKDDKMKAGDKKDDAMMEKK